ncbi:Maf1-domain-containing protein [Wallemia mellicola]|uniref:Maf1-domain-containing protein n=1 Tax=Wallemia mellicola TaxID=1708541 RepID=A0A4T0MSK9_9BASI|nr:Maf1-domain-containing protein [Wallemia mellicola]TIB86337.1 Maf1-domain-containing protein [Wallemia mellicola]TIB98316.1 Maf1-domain-containing protein [Wallemia mellicola]TIC00072.1 Maf1-domain-containing protein [Wallemia mellicola]TIC11857.1 Maf1-domain-containing protein [Wallemia mellicola]
MGSPYKRGPKIVRTRIEAYSCKQVKSDKKLYKLLESTYNTQPPSDTPFGNMDLPSTRKTLYLLISTLNQAFPDHDFTDVRPDEFIREPSSSSIVNKLGMMLLRLKDGNSRSYGYYPTTTLGSSADSYQSMDDHQSHLTAQSTVRRIQSGGSITMQGFQAILDDVIHVQDCDVFSYSPDATSDPHSTFDDYDDDGDSLMDDDDDTHFDLDMEELDHQPKSQIPSYLLDQDKREASPALSNRSTGQSTIGDSGSGLLWSTHYFFYNKKLKRVLFFTVWSRKLGVYSQGPHHLPISDNNPFWLSSSLPPPVKLEDDYDGYMFSSSLPTKSRRTRTTTRKTKASAGGAGGSKPIQVPKNKRRAANAGVSKSTKGLSNAKKSRK